MRLRWFSRSARSRRASALTSAISLRSDSISALSGSVSGGFLGQVFGIEFGVVLIHVQFPGKRNARPNVTPYMGARARFKR